MKQPGQQVYNILVVDDEPTVRDSICMLLVHFGHTVQASDHAGAALALLSTNRFHLVITDYFMQDMKGDELARLIKLQHPGLPVIMATAYADGLKADGGLDGSVDYFLTKPFSMAELRDAVAQVMR